MTSRRIEGMDELVVQAAIPRVFGVTVDAVRDLGAAIDGGDLEKGLLNIRYVRKATERRLATMSALNRAIATTIEDPVGSYQVQMQPTDQGLIMKVVPTGAAASIGGANELIREFRERLYSAICIAWQRKSRKCQSSRRKPPLCWLTAISV